MARRDLTGAVDFARLEAYAAGDGAVIDEVLAMFPEQARQWMRLFDEGGAADAWHDAAHAIKGAALGVGADALAQACAEAEGAAGADAGSRARLLARVRDALDAALADIAAYAHERALQSLKTPLR